jgi:hypothetical protein
MSIATFPWRRLAVSQGSLQTFAMACQLIGILIQLSQGLLFIAITFNNWRPLLTKSSLPRASSVASLSFHPGSKIASSNHLD